MKQPLKRITSFFLVLLFMLPICSDLLRLLPVRAAEEFVLLLDWEVTTSNNVVLSADRRDLDLTPPHNSVNANSSGLSPHSVRLKVEFAPPQGVDAAPGEVEVRVPMYIFQARDGSNIVNTTLANSQGTHAVTTTPGHLSGLKYEIDEDTDEFVFINWAELTGGIYTVVNITYSYIPEKIKDGFINDSIVATAEFVPEEGNREKKESAPLSVKVNTFVAPPASFSVNWYRTSDTSLFKYESWQTSPNFGTRPAGSEFGPPYSVFTADDIGKIDLGDGKYVALDDVGKDKYYYLIWEIKYQRRANRSTQPYYINIDIELSELGGGEIVGICGRDYFNNADIGLANTPFISQAAAQINEATVISPASFPSTTATVNLLTYPSTYNTTTLDTRGDSYLQTMYRWVLVRYPRGEGPELGYNVDTSLSAKLTLTGIDHMNDPDEGTGSDLEDNAKWESGQTGAETKPASPVAGRGAYIGDPKYTHVREASGPVYNYKPVIHTYGGNLFQTLKYHAANYAGNSVPTIYSAINKLSEGSVTNPISVPVLRTLSEAYSFRLRTEARGWNLTRAGIADIIPGIDSDDPRNFYQKDYTIEVIDGMKFLRDVRLAPDDYSITRSYLTYTEYNHTFNPNNGNLTAFEVPYYDGNPTPAQLTAMAPYAQVAPYAPVEIWYKTIFSGDNWLKAGEVKRTATSVYTYTTTDGTQLENPAAPMSSTNQLKLPGGTYEIKYIHTSSRFQVNIDNYITVELKSTNRVLSLLDGGVVDGTTYGRTDTAQFRNIHSMAVIDSAGMVRNTVPVANIYARSWPGATYNVEASAWYQGVIEERSHQLYNTLPGESVEQHYTYVNLNRTVATTAIDKINTADRLDDDYVRNGYVADNTIKDDGVNGLKSIHQSVRIYDQINYNPNLVPGTNREERLEDLAANNIFKQLTEGTFYDLLPPGTYIEGGVEAFTYYLDPYVSQGNATVEAHARTANETNRKNALVNWYTVDNWQGSGRTMLVVNVKAPEATNYQVYDTSAGTKWMSPSGVEYEAQAANASYANRRIATNAAGYEQIRSGFILNYNLVTTYANIFDRSDAAGNFNAYNVVAFRNRTGRLASGANTVPGTTPWTYVVSGGTATTPTTARTNNYFMSLESDPPTRDDNNNTYNTAYASSTTTFPIPDAYNYGITKHVRSQSDPDFIEEAQTIPGGVYQYQLHFLSGPSKYYTEIKMFDILENEPDNEWNGTLIDVDTSFARSLGCAPVVYYSTVPAEDLKLISDPVNGVYSTTEQAEFDAEIDDKPIWSTVMPTDKSTVTAIVVDFTKATNGSNFQITKGDSIYVVVNMLAPTDAAIYEPIIAGDLKARNRIGYSTVEVNPYNLEDKANTVRLSEPTTVTMRNVEFDIGKTSFPASGTISDAQAVDREDIIEYTLAVMNLDILPAKEVTVVDTLPVGVTLNTGDIRYYSGADASKANPLPGWIKITRSDAVADSGDSRVLTFVIDDMNAQQTINLVIPVTVDPAIAFGSMLLNSAVVIGINGAEYDIDSETTYHQVYPRVTLEGSVSLEDRYLRVNEFEFALTDNTPGSPTFGEVLSQVKNDTDGNFIFAPLGFKEPGTYVYSITEAPDTVPAGNLPSGAPGEVEYDVTAYTVTIVVTKDPSGEMTTITTIVKTGETEPSDIDFSNKYIPDPVYMPLELNKILNGRVLSDGEFRFSVTDTITKLPATVYDADEQVIVGDLENTASGLTNFKLKFTEPGTYTYEVREINDGLENVTYDAGVYTITIVVGKTSVDPNSVPTPINSVQRNDGRLSISSQPEIKDADNNDSRIGFTNKFTPAPVTATITGSKVLTGGRPLQTDEFSFTLTDVTDPENPRVIETVKNDAAGKITFSAISYTDEDAGTYGKTFYYTISEVVPVPADPNITYAAPVTVRVNIGIDRDKGELSSSVVNQNFVITNTYTPDPVSVQIVANKRLESSGSLAAGQFSFVLRNTTNSDSLYHFNMETVSNDESGAITFTPIMYTAPGVYKYSIQETPGGNSKIIYDSTVYSITVNVTQNTITGELEAGTPLITKDDDGKPLSFVNTAIYDVTFKQNVVADVTIAAKSTEYETALESNMPADPTYPGRTFSGWNTEPDGSGEWFDEDTPVTSDITVYAIWGRIGYTVTFDTKGGTSDVENITGFLYEDTINTIDETLPVPTYPGYTFLGWNSEENGTGSWFDEDTQVTENITVYARWSWDEYTVIYSPGDEGTWDPDEVGTYKFPGLRFGDVTPVQPATPGNPGWTFTGWASDWSDTVTGNVTYTAQWSKDAYSVTFDGNGGVPTVPVVSGFGYGDTFGLVDQEIPPPWPRSGYIFMGWNFEQGGEGNNFDDETQIKGNVTVYAQWEAIEYTVIYEPGDHGGWDPEGDAGYIFDILLYGDSTPLPALIPGEPGWTFMGWSPEWSDTVTENATYTAQWSKDSYSVTFDGNGGEPYIKTVTGFEYDDTFSSTGYTMPPHPPDRPGYIFRGWSTGQTEGSLIDFDENTPIGGNTTVYAQWEAIEYTVMYYPGEYGDWAPGDTDYTTAGLYYGDMTPYPATVSSLDGDWHFAKWSPVWNDKVTEDVIYTALWVIDPDLLIVSFHPGTGGLFPSEDCEPVPPGSPTPYPSSAPSLGTEPIGETGWVFAGWLPVVNGVVISEPVYNFEDITVTGHVDYIAQWIHNPELYTVTYEPGEGGDWDPAEDGVYNFPNLQYGELTPLQPTSLPAKPGWIFSGWSPVWSGTVTGDVTYVAQWTKEDIKPPTPPVLPGDEPTWIPPQLPVTVTTKENAEEPEPESDVDTPDPDPFVESLPELPDEPYAEQPSDWPPQDTLQELPLNIVLPEGTTQEDFPNIDLNAKQSDLSQPGGDDISAPPVPNDPDNMLMAQIDDDGNVYFMEITDPNSPPLGMWLWNAEEGRWIFIEADTPLGELPATGLNPISSCLSLTGFALIGLGLLVRRKSLKKSPLKSGTPSLM